LLGDPVVNVGEVYFVLRGDAFDPAVVTAALGIEPSRVNRKAHYIPKRSSWELSTGKISAEIIDVYKMGESLIDKLAESADAIRSVAAEHNLEATLQVVLTVSPDDRLPTPAIGFSRESIRFLASVGASIDVDTYRGVKRAAERDNRES
jgi:hypothetical protein